MESRDAGAGAAVGADAGAEAATPDPAGLRMSRRRLSRSSSSSRGRCSTVEWKLDGSMAAAGFWMARDAAPTTLEGAESVCEEVITCSG